MSEDRPTPTLAETYPLLASGLAMLTRFVNMTPEEIAALSETITPTELAELFEARGDVILALNHSVHPFIDTVARTRMMVDSVNLLERGVRAHARELPTTQERVAFLTEHAGCCLMPEPQWRDELKKREADLIAAREAAEKAEAEAKAERDRYRTMYDVLKQRVGDGILALPPAVESKRSAPAKSNKGRR